MKNWEIMDYVLNKDSREEYETSLENKDNVYVPNYSMNLHFNLTSFDKQIDYTLKSIESFSQELDILCKFPNMDYTPYFGTENDEKRPNIFIRIWKKFVEIITKVFQAIINFFKTLIKKIVTFFKILINKIFKRGKSKEDIARKMVQYDRFSNLTLTNKDHSKSQESNESDDNCILPNEILYDLAICQYNKETFGKLKRMCDYTKAFVTSTTDLMKKEVQLESTINVGNELFVDAWESKKSVLEKTKSTLRKNVIEYFGTLVKTASLDINSYIDEHTKSSFSVNGNVIARAVLSNRSKFIKNIKDLERFSDNSAFLKKSAKTLSVSEMCTKEFFIRIYRMDDEVKNEYKKECAEMSTLCKDLETASNDYYNLIKTKSVQFGKKCKEGIIDKEMKEYMKNFMHSLKEDQHLISTVIKISNFSFNFRVNVLRFIEIFSNKFDHIQKQEFKTKWKGKSIKTLYGMLPIGIIKLTDFNVPDAIKKACFEITKNFLNEHFGSGNKLLDKTQIMWTKTIPGTGELTGMTEHINNKKKNTYVIRMHNKITRYIIQGVDTIISLVENYGLPFEVIIVSTLIHELTHEFQHSDINSDKDESSALHSDIYMSDPKKAKKKQQIKKIAGKDVEKQKIVAKHIDNTFYRGILNEQNANHIKINFIRHILRQLYSDDKATLELIEKQILNDLKGIFLNS
jgi:hypothetical protein